MPIASHKTVLEFSQNHHAQMIFGEMNNHLAFLEKKFNVRIDQRGNILELQGNLDSVNQTSAILHKLYADAVKGQNISISEIEAEARMAGQISNGVEPFVDDGEEIIIKTRKHSIKARSIRQKAYLKHLLESDMVFGIGPAGTGKTYLAVSVAVTFLLEGKVDKLILSRPAVEAGEHLGFLPGDMKEKVDPYLRPLYDALNDMLPADQINRYLTSGQIEIAPLAFMRGRTLTKSFVILDEAQNCTTGQMKMFLTRLGEGTRMVITGDPTQIDLPKPVFSGLREAMRILKDVEDIKMVHFDESDVVRHPLVAKIIHAYHNNERKERGLY